MNTRGIAGGYRPHTPFSFSPAARAGFVSSGLVSVWEVQRSTTKLVYMQGAPNPSLIDEAPLTSPRPHDRDPDVDTPAVKRVVRSNVPRPGTAGGRRLKCGAAEISKRRPKTPSVADILRGVREGDAESEKWSDAMTARSTATVSPDRVVATKHAWLLGDGAAPSNDGYGDGFGESKMTEL